MCGRITQYRGRRQYADEIGWEPDPTNTHMSGPWGPDRIPQYNLTPGLYPDVMHALHEGQRAFDTIYWGYQPPWAKEKGLPPSINARLETAATKPYFRHMFRLGRVIVPADGWYEWTGEKGNKQPWYIRLKTDRPMFMAAITNFRPFTAQDKQVGVVILTAEASGGLVDVHDRRPVVLTPDDARIWMDNTLPVDEAEQLARSCLVPPDRFEWYPVTRAVNNAKNNERHMIEPVSE